MKEKDYSIIIPHYNIPHLLTRLLASIPQRHDTEIILVDDNSDPDVADFHSFPGKERADVRFIFDKKGGGGGYARNLGLNVAKGKWILFADADDFFNDCLNNVLNQYKDCDADIVFFKASSVDSDTYQPMCRTNHLNKMIDLHASNPQKSEIQLRYVFGEPWGKLIKRKLVIENGISFEETNIHNDTRFSYMVGHYAKQLRVDRRELYCVTSRSNSVSKQLSDDRILTRIRVFSEAERFYVSHSINVAPVLHYPYSQLAVSFFDNYELFQKGCAIVKENGFGGFHIFKCLVPLLLKQMVKKIIRK